MRLELASYTVRDVQLEGPTRLVDGTLYVDRDELCRLIFRTATSRASRWRWCAPATPCA